MTSANRVVLPSDCILAFCLPMDEASYKTTAGVVGSYSSQFKGGWHQYKDLFVQEASRSIGLMRSRGVAVETDITLAAFSQLVSDRRWKAVILFSHWHEDAVEFSDGFHDYAEITRTLDPEVSCLLDLCICHPNALVSQLLIQRPSLNLRTTKVQSSPQVWFAFYTAFFSVLSKGLYSYFEAFETVAAEFLRQSDQATNVY
jgi:hypothetical protein